MRVQRIGALAGVLAEGQGAPLSRAMHLIEESLLDVGGRVDGLRARAGNLAKTFRVERKRNTNGARDNSRSR